MKGLTRRSFVASAAVAGAALGFTGALSGCTTQAELADTDGDGEAAAGKPNYDYYTTECHGCICNCPVKAYVEDGVVKKLEGHPDGVRSMGSLCIKGLNQLHTVYSPRHVIYPMRRTGARGAENMAFERVSWDEAIDEAAQNIVNVFEKYGTYSMLSTTGGGGAYIPATTLPLCSASVFAPSGFEPGAAQCWMPRVGVPALMGMPNGQSMADNQAVEPFKGLSASEQALGATNNTEVLVLWGTQPSSSQTARSGRGMAELRARGCKTIVVDPFFTADAAKATVHLPVRPGSDPALMLSWLRIIFEEKLYDEEFTKFYTNMPFLINPDTKLPWLATEVFDDYVPTTPDNTPVYVCVDEATGEVKPLPFGKPENVIKEVNPAVFATAQVKGKESKTAGQIYKETADPWTPERAEEFCWVPADRIRKAVEIYTAPAREGKTAGIAHGVATDMMECASQASLGALAMDAIMGYVNKPGCTVTEMGLRIGPLALMGNYPLDATNEWGKCVADGVQPRPTRDYSTFGYGYVVGMSDEENTARIAEQDPKKMEVYSTMVLDRLGLSNHRGLTTWNQSHIPAVREAIETGEPYRPRVWMEVPGNKFCAIGSAGAWYNAAMSNMDYVTHQYPNFTSFDAELTDMFFPTEEWLEMANHGGSGSDTITFTSVPAIHLGETVNPVRPFRRMLDKVYEIANGRKDKIVFNGTGQTIAEIGLDFPLFEIPNAGPPADRYDDSTQMQNEIRSMAGALGLDPESCTEKEFMEAIKNNPKALRHTDPADSYTYGQHLVLADDGLPRGFYSESRKIEVYCSAIIKLGRTGWPYHWPKTFDEPVDARIGSFGGDYSPICTVPVQVEAPYVENAGEFILEYDEEFPLALTSGRRPFFHHGTMRHAPFSRELYPVPFLYINPATAEEYGIADGDWVEVSSRRTQGEDYDPSRLGTERSYNHEKDHATKTCDPIRTVAYLTEAVAPKVVWMERYWNPECFDNSQETKTGGWRESGVNVLTNAIDANFNEVFGSYTNRGFAVNVKKSERPERVWVTPEEFEPFMPTSENQTCDGIGVLRDNAELRNHYTDFSF